MSTLTKQDRQFFRQHGYLTKTDLLSADTISDYQAIYDGDRDTRRYRWHPYGYHQSANYDALITSPDFDRIVRDPGILGTIEALMGGPTCFGEIGARHMKPYEGDLHRGWHRDRPHWPDHPFRMDYIQSMVYLTDVTPDTHCFSLSPESVDEPILEQNDDQLARGGIVDIHGPAGTVCLFNVSVLHTATTRTTTEERKTVQTYYGHLDRPPLANDSVIPPCFWKHGEPATRTFYGNLNEVSRTYAAAFGVDLSRG